jgi:hypothetical protein
MYPNAYTAILGGDGYVYPVRNQMESGKPGVFITGGLDIFNAPQTEQEKSEFSVDNIIDFGKAENMRDLMQCKQMLNQAERSIITTVDNLFTPDIGENDTPQMRAMKEAVIAKGIDLDKYESRLGPNFNNDKRLFKREDITIGKIRTIAEALDMKVTLIIEDTDPNVPNPIGKTIVAQITGDPASFEEED